MRKRILKIAAVAGLAALVLIVGLGLWVRSKLSGSLPQLDGEIVVEQLEAPAVIQRDAAGIPMIIARNRNDLAFATGFAHGQDRFFQMDLLRRNSAGELSELVGAAALAADRRVRVNQFRERGKRVVEAGPETDRALLEAYADGVNAGLKSLRVRPFEYLLLGIEPEPWKPEDCALVLFSMYLDLQGEDFGDESKLGLMHDLLPQGVFDFVAPRGTQWDAPIHGEAFQVAPTPPADVYDTRKLSQAALNRLAPPGMLAGVDVFHPGSNNWAISASRTADGRAIVADDMHLGIRVPHIWYRASLHWPDASDPEKGQQITGVTLPGTPAVIVGSNGHVAWGFTNSEGDWCDVVIVETDPNDSDSYLTPDGPRKFEHATETIKVKGGADEQLEVISTIWGPILDHDHKGRPRAIRWVAHDVDGVNLQSLHLESARTLEEALELANLSGAPAQNFMVADDRGRIAWTILGRIPRRVGFDGRLPSSWADGTRRWDGYLNPQEYPRIIEPESGRLWTANARVVSGDLLAKLGDGGYDLGARARQIRDDLFAADTMDEEDMLRIQLDDRAVFLEPWQKLLLEVLSPEAIKSDPRRAELRKYVEDWGGRASIDSVGFRAVRAFRRALIGQLSDVLVAPCKQADKDFSIAKLDRTEGPVWRLVSERPENLIDPRYESWEALLLAAADGVLANAQEQQGALARYTWGDYNTTKIHHPISAALPGMLASWVNMPAQPLPGDSDNMPRIQSPTNGASQRMAVSPGHEEQGYMHMPCGQSGHPLSPHYGDQHAAWAEGKPTPFLPGPATHKLVLKPAQQPSSTTATAMAK